MFYSFLKPQYKVKLKRLGDHFDGGYLIPEQCIKHTELLVSFGLGNNWSFEKDFKKANKKIKIYCYDHAITRRFWVEFTIISFFFFIKNFKNFFNIFKFIEYKFFFSKKLNNFHIKKKIVPKKFYTNEISINDLSKIFKQKIFLKIDIENDEYRILNYIKNFEQILGFTVEFHYLDLNYIIIKNFLKNNSNLKIVHLHANNMGGLDINKNPTTIEITFINKKLCKEYEIVKNRKFKKNILDFPNDPSKKDLKINFK